MELELGFKITQTRADGTSTSNLSIAKDRAGPVFVSRETDTMFILTAHLKGFTRDNVGIKINEDGSRITISGKRPVQEIVMRRWMVYKKDVEMRGLTKTFRIPDGVVLDKIRAKFSEDDSILTVSMPKLVKGISGLSIEEVKEGPEPETPQGVAADKVLDNDVKKVTDEEPLVTKDRIGGITDKESEERPKEPETLGEPEKEEQEAAAELPHNEEIRSEEKDMGEGQERAQPTQALEEHVPDTAPVHEDEEDKDEVHEEESEREHGDQKQEPNSDVQEPTKEPEPNSDVQEPTKEQEPEPNSDVQEPTKEQEPEPNSDVQEPTKEQEPKQNKTPTPVAPPADETQGQETQCAEEEEEEADQEASEVEEQNDEDEPQEEKKKNGLERSKLGVPIIIAGSAILVSLFVYVVHSIRTKKRS